MERGRCAGRPALRAAPWHGLSIPASSAAFSVLRLAPVPVGTRVPRYRMRLSQARSPSPETPAKKKRSREAAAGQPGSRRHMHGGGSGSALDLVLPNWLMTPQPGLQQPVAGAAGGWLCPGSVPPKAMAAGLRHPWASRRRSGWSQARGGWHGSSGATRGGKRRARPGLPAHRRRENPRWEQATEAGTGPPVSRLLLRDALTKKREQRDEKPLVGRGNGQVPPRRRRGQARPFPNVLKSSQAPGL